MPDESSAGKHTLNALFISLDKNLFDEQQGDVRERHLRYAIYFNQLNIIVFTKRSDGFSVPQYLANNLRVFPTNSSSRWMFVTDALKIARNIRKQQRVDVVSTQDPFITAIVGIVIKLFSGAHLNIQIHNDYRSPYWKNESVQNRIFSILLRVTLPFADSVRTVSRLTSNMIKDSSKVFIAPIAVDLNFFKPSNAEKITDVICVARLDKQKNIPLLIKALAEVKKNHPKLKAMIVGDGRQKGEAEKEIKRQGLTKTITLRGRVGREKVRSLLSQSRMFVLPSNYEGWGLVAVEAAACGLPVVMTNTGGAKDIVRDGQTGYIVPINDASAIEEYVTRLLENPQQSQTMGDKGRRWVEKIFKQDKSEKSWIRDLVKQVNTRSKVCFILPELDPHTATHYPYTLKLFTEYAKDYPAALFIEKGGTRKKSSPFEKVIVQKSSMKPINLLERCVLLWKLRRHGFTTFYIHYSYWSLFLLRMLSVIRPTKIFYWHAEEFTKNDLQKMGFIERFLLKSAMKLAPNLVTAGATLTIAYAETFDIPMSKISVIPNWVEPILKRPEKVKLRRRLGLPEEEKIIIYVHRLSERKGAHLLPAIISGVREKVKNTYFVIIGSGPLEKTLKTQISDKDVSFIGNLPHYLIYEYYAAADLFIMPSVREGFPRVILEAMTAGLPIVSTQVGEVTGIMSDRQRSYTVAADKQEAFVKAIVRLIENEKERIKLGEENLNQVNRFSLGIAKESLIRVLQMR